MAESLNGTSDYDNYSDSEIIVQHVARAQAKSALKFMYIGTYSTIMLIGVPLNCLVIITSLYKRRSPVWFLGLAIMDLIFCLFLTFYIMSAWNNFSWQFGVILCKTSSYVVFITMHSTALILALMNLDHVLARLCPCLSSSHSRSLNMLLFSWFVAVILSIPSLFFRVVQFTVNGKECMDNYDQSSVTITSMGMKRNKAVVYMRLFVGILLPLVFIGISCALGNLKRNKNNELKYIQITNAVTIAYFVCWVPYQILSVMQMNNSFTSSTESVQVWLPVATALAAFNSCVKPMIYYILGRSVGLQWMNSSSPTSIAEEREMTAEITAEEEQSNESKKPLNAQASP